MRVHVVKTYRIEVDYAEYSRIVHGLTEYCTCPQHPPDSKSEVKALRDALYGYVWGWGGCPSDCTSTVHDHPPAKEANVD